jgi:translation initiation factor IF-2
MAKRLVKVAKELNVGTSTIVEYLVNNGFEIDNKPTAKVSDEMYAKLLQEFSHSKEEKSKADSLIIGNRAVEEEAPKPTPVVAPPPPPPPVEKKVEVKPEPKKVEKPEEVKVEAPKLSVKVVDKIDLDKNKAPAPKAEAPDKKPDPKPEASKPVEAKKEEAPKKEEVTKPTAAPVDDTVRAKTPQLQGLKIMGKIDTDKLKTKPKRSEKAKDEKPGEAGDKTKRKRKRKKIITNTGGGNRGDNRGGNRRGGNNRGNSRGNEVKEVSKKEIEDKIKATMARIKGGKSNKRQKIRRDSRVDKRERQEILENEGVTETIQLTEFISVSELASLLDIQATDIIMSCMNMGVIVSINQRLDAEIIELIADEHNREIEFISAEAIDEDQEEIVDDPADLEPRAPIVTVMGHVDHGKTSLLDYIRKANVASGEAGGITQHIGAYEVKVNGKKVTFLDTPGHEAFTAMRARGAKVTDVVIIIIAADDRIMPQTKEAISHAQAAGVPMIFAINKIDKDGASPDRIKQELAGMNLLVEEWGGQFQSQDISAKTGLGIDDLLEKILLEAEVLELQANPNRNSIGTVIEASLDKGRGYVTKMLVQTGTMSIGDVVVAGGASGKVKAMFNERGERLKSAGPSTPLLLLGLNGAPQAGEKFKVVDSEQEARQIAAKRQQIDREQSNRANKRISLDEIGRRLALGSFKELNLIVKGDVDGSIEALSDSLIKLSIESVQVNVIHKAVGQIAESDVLLASASDAIIVGFQVRPSSGARNLAEKEGVQIKTYSIIYEAIDEIKSAIEGMLEPTKEEKVMGEVEVRETFKISKVGTIAGSFVTSGMISRNSLIRVVRDGIVMYPNKQGQVGEISALKRFKDDVKEVKKGLECGVLIKNYNDIKVGDIIEAYEIVEIKQTLD